MSTKVSASSLINQLWPGSSPTTQANGLLLTIEQQSPAEAAFTCISFCPDDNTRFVIGDSVGTIYHVLMKKNKMVVSARLSSGMPITAIAFLTSSTVVAASAIQLHIVDLDHGRVEQRAIRTPHTNHISNIIVHPSRKNFAVTLSSDSVALWNTAPFQCTHHSHESGMGGNLVMNFTSFVGAAIADVMTLSTAHEEASVDAMSTVLVTAESQGFLTIWSVADFKPSKRVDVAPFKPTSLAVCSKFMVLGTRQGKLLCFSSDLEAISSVDIPGGTQITNISLIESQIVACQTNDGHVWFIGTADYSVLFSVSYPSLQSPKAMKLSDPTYSAVVTQSSVYVHHLPTAKAYYNRSITGTSGQGSMKSQSVMYPFIRSGAEKASSSQNGTAFDHAIAAESTQTSLPRQLLKVEDSQVNAWIKVNLVANASTNSVSVSQPKTLLLVDAVRSQTNADVQTANGGSSSRVTTATTNHSLTRRAHSSTGTSKTRHSMHTTSSIAKSNKSSEPESEVVSLRGFLDHDSRVVNMEKLRAMLLRYGTFPTRYRPLIWRFLLQLPEKRVTESQFANLTVRGPHPAVRSLMAPFPLPETKLRNTLFNTLSALAWHSPVFSAVHFIPNLVFPFVKLYGSDIQSSVEVLMAFLINWGQEFFLYYPHPPVAVLSFVSHTLQFLCPELHAHFAQHGVGSDVYVWDVMSSIYTEVLTRNEWLQTMDHAFANEPVWLFLFHVCWLSHLKAPLMELKEHSQIVAALRRATPLNLPLVIQNTYQLQRKYIQSDLSFPYRRFNSFQNDLYPPIMECNEAVITSRVRELEKVQAHETEILNMRDRITHIKKQLMQATMLEDAFVGKQKAIVASQFEATNDVWVQQVQLEKERQRLRDIEHETRLGALHEQLRSAQRIEAMQREIYAAAAGTRDAEMDRQREVMKWDFANRMANQEIERLEAGARMKLASVLQSAEALSEQANAQQRQFVDSIGGSALADQKVGNTTPDDHISPTEIKPAVPPYPPRSPEGMQSMAAAGPKDEVSMKPSTHSTIARPDIHSNTMKTDTQPQTYQTNTSATTSTPPSSCAADPIGYYRELQENIRRTVQQSHEQQRNTIAGLNSRYARALLHDDEDDNETEVTEPICDDAVASEDDDSMRPKIIRPEAKRTWSYEASVTSDTTQSSSMTKALLAKQPRGFFSTK